MEKDIFKKILNSVYTFGDYSSPRGLKILEIENFHYELPPYERFMNFKSRKLNIDYIKEEIKWYLIGDEFDISIVKHAKMWGSLINENGGINSNYGQYVFGKQNQFDRVIETLKNDKDSRRATIVILSKDHLEAKTNDYPCTYSINFHIRDNKLNMIVNMRSQDAIFGMGNDVPCFSFIHEMMFVSLRETYKELEYGMYYHNADSFHVYEKHFEMLEKILEEDEEFTPIECPKILNKNEVDFLRKSNFENIPEEFKFTQWLNKKI